jgi:Protein of unknown function (DUF4058)
MASPFPGMDPYLEQSAFWSSFHSKFIVALADAIEAKLDQDYYVEVETRTYLEGDGTGLLVGIPDVSVGRNASAVDLLAESTAGTAVATAVQPIGLQKVIVPMPEEMQERYLEIREVNSGNVVTAIELLSPKNKRAGAGRQSYENKRSLILGSFTHLVEIDLLRGGQSMPIGNVVASWDYSVLVSRSEQRPQADLYSFSIRDPLPEIAIPLIASGSLAIDLQLVFSGVYQRSRYNTRIDYQQPIPPPKLSTEDQHWIEQLIFA